MEQNDARKQNASPEINSREMEVYGVQGQINKHCWWFHENVTLNIHSRKNSCKAITIIRRMIRV